MTRQGREPRLVTFSGTLAMLIQPTGLDPAIATRDSTQHIPPGVSRTNGLHAIGAVVDVCAQLHSCGRCLYQHILCVFPCVPSCVQGGSALPSSQPLAALGAQQSCHGGCRSLRVLDSPRTTRPPPLPPQLASPCGGPSSGHVALPPMVPTRRRGATRSWRCLRLPPTQT